MTQINLTSLKDFLLRLHEFSLEAAVSIFPVGELLCQAILNQNPFEIELLVIGEQPAYHQFLEIAGANGLTSAGDDHYFAEPEQRQNHAFTLVPRHIDPGERPIMEALTAALAARAISIDAMAVQISPDKFGALIDPFNGRADLKAKIIRSTDDPKTLFAENPLAMMRTVYLAARYDCHLEEELITAIQASKKFIKTVPQPQKTTLFRKMMLLSQPSGALDLLRKTELTSQVFPELDTLAGVEQRREYHHKDVFYHTLQVVDNISEMTDDFALRMVALLHDIAKPETKRFVEGIGWTFHGHEELGARMARRIGRRMQLPRPVIKYIEKLVRLHMRPTQLVDDEVTDSAIRRLQVEAGEDIDDLMTMCRADITSQNPRKVQRYLGNFDQVESRIKAVTEKDRVRNFKPAFDGNDIMTLLNIGPGKVIGQLRQAVVDAILAGEIPNEFEACKAYFLKIKDQYLPD